MHWINPHEKKPLLTKNFYNQLRLYGELTMCPLSRPFSNCCIKHKDDPKQTKENADRISEISKKISEKRANPEEQISLKQAAKEGNFFAS